MKTQIVVKVKDGEAIVRKTTNTPHEHYALAKNGQWILVPEGKPYPEQCILPVILYNNPPAETT